MICTRLHNVSSIVVIGKVRATGLIVRSSVLSKRRSDTDIAIGSSLTQGRRFLMTFSSSESICTVTSVSSSADVATIESVEAS